MIPLIVDSFAGGGGASTGIEMALGRSPDIAINHNPVALALHAANHPATLHLSENVYRVDPLDHLARKHIGLMWFSPDCKHFSKAKGGKPVERNIRDLAWIIPGWVERIQKSGGAVDVVILENVEEFRSWGPLVETAAGLMPCPDGRGKTFAKWCGKLKRLGGRLEWRELRACDFGAPTIRKRLFIIVRFDGRKIVWPGPTHGRPDDPEIIAGRKKPWRTAADGGRAGAAKLKPWRTAAEIIDWSLPCPSIFDSGAQVLEKHGLRAVRPLAPATMARVARGVDRYVLKAAKPFVVKFQSNATGHAIDDPLATVTANSFIKWPGGAAPLGVIAPSLVKNMTNNVPDSPEEPLSTILTGNHHMMVAPALIPITHTGDRRTYDPQDPLRTITTANGGEQALVAPVLVGCGGRAGQSRPRPGDEPVATVTAKADVCVTAAFLAQHNTGVVGHAAGEPVSTVVQKGCTQSVVAASLVGLKGGDRRDSGADQPHPTVLAGGAAVIAPHLMTMRNAGKPFNGADEPAHTVTAGGAGLSLVAAELRFGEKIHAPFMQKYYGTGDGARVDEPFHTVTVKDRFGFVEGEAAPPPLTSAQLDRAREVAAFLRSHGFWDDRAFVTVSIPPSSLESAEGRQTDRSSGAAGGEAADAPREVFTIIDIGMRMLTPRELFSAQGFPPDYIIDLEFEGRAISKSDQIAACGNSVSPPVAAALAAANCGHLAVLREAAE